MAALKEPDCLKFVSPILKTGKEFQKRDPVITYYCNVYAIQKALSQLGKKRPKEADAFLLSMMDQVEQMKKQLVGDEAVTSEVVAQAHVESKALQLFTYADNEDRGGRFGKNVVKAFYTAHILFEIVSQFGEQSQEVQEKQKYAKWKAAYISRCLKDGQTPIAGPVGGDEGDDDNAAAAAGGPPLAGAAAAQPGYPPQQAQSGYPPQQGGTGGFGGFDVNAATHPGDPNAIPGFVQPMNPMASFVPPTNPASTFNQGPPTSFNPPPSGASQPPADNFGQPPMNNFSQPSNSPYPPPTATQGVPSFDASAAAAANAAAMANLQQPHVAPRSVSPTPSPSGSLRPTPAPRQVDYAGKLLPVPSAGEFRPLEYDKKSRLEKLLKYANSALMYDDMLNVVQNLTRAHNLVCHGREE
ncbi:vacuolar protein sorting-associated protein VTA1 homolog [Sycon ciliatum]|uniref:vacuolar protein sorting-associated protein VTA1 homolog n=1 Tax=Sycon ciliatum TaxID=27933 RepID=UPI0020AE8BDC|eukprot:scpid72755/ scgid24239/ Vacuolar protein sorting-associated protein VTA1 homolog